MAVIAYLGVICVMMIMNVDEQLWETQFLSTLIKDKILDVHIHSYLFYSELIDLTCVNHFLYEDKDSIGTPFTFTITTSSTIEYDKSFSVG